MDRIRVMRSDGGSPLRLTDGAGTHFAPSFSRDGRFFFTSLQSGTETIRSVRPQGVPIIPQPTAAKEGGGPENPKPAPAVSVGINSGR